MYTISECVACAVVTFTLSAFVFAFCVALLAIEQQIANRRASPSVFQRFDMLFGAQPATVLVHDKRSGR